MLNLSTFLRDFCDFWRGNLCKIKQLFVTLRAMIIYGKQLFLHLLNTRPAGFSRVFLSKEVEPKLFARIARLGVKVERIDNQRAQSLARGGVHQGFLAEVAPFELASWASVRDGVAARAGAGLGGGAAGFSAGLGGAGANSNLTGGGGVGVAAGQGGANATHGGASGFIAVLWGVSDVGNIGAITRTAWALGADALVVVAKSLNFEGLARASSGAAFELPICLVADGFSALNELSQRGVKLVCAAAQGAGGADALGKNKKTAPNSNLAQNATQNATKNRQNQGQNLAQNVVNSNLTANAAEVLATNPAQNALNSNLAQKNSQTSAGNIAQNLAENDVENLAQNGGQIPAPNPAQTPLARRVALIMGSEGEGLPRGVIGRCDEVASVRMRRAWDSLNVSVAFGILAERILNEMEMANSNLA